MSLVKLQGESLMKFIVCFLIILFSVSNKLVAQEPNELRPYSIIQADSVDCSLKEHLDNRRYGLAYLCVQELSKRDTLSLSVLYNCADCLVRSERYNECLEFCDKWQSKNVVSQSDSLFMPIRGECYFFLRDYKKSTEYLSRYDSLLMSHNCVLDANYKGLYAKSLHNISKYKEANDVYESLFKDVISREGCKLSNIYACENKIWYGSQLYDYAYNSFFMGNESLGMDLLCLSSKCGNEYAQKDHNHLSKCETIMMDLDLKNNFKNQFIDYINRYDFQYKPNLDLTTNIVEDFWTQLLNVNASYVELLTEMQNPKPRKMLIKACAELISNKNNLLLKLNKNCVGVEDAEFFEQSLVSKFAGENNSYLKEFKIYLAEDSNAFATPFGQIYLTSGLVLKYNLNEKLLIGVCAHEMTHLMCQHSLVNLWKQYEKERKKAIIGGIVAGLYAATMTASAIYGASNGYSYNQSFYDNMAVTTTNLYRAIQGADLYFQFKYAREQEIESDIIAYRFCEAIGIGGYAYIMALQLLGETDLYMRVDKTDDHPTLGYRVALLKYIHSMEHSS